MSKITQIHQFSDVFGINKKQLDQIGVLDPTLNIDTPLFIDPKLLQTSKHTKFAENSHRSYESYFAKIIKLLRVSSQMDDVAWRSAEKLLLFSEVKGTCLGYGTSSVRGSGIGAKYRDIIINTAKEIIELGICDPELFSVLALFEPGIGADRISDMTTNVILNDLLDFNEFILSRLSIQLAEFNIIGRQVLLPQNPYLGITGPVILVPNDILRRLPIAKDWDSIDTVVSANNLLRTRINKHVGEIWAVATRRDKVKLKSVVLSSKDAFEAVLNAIGFVEKIPYDLVSDPKGEVYWRKLSKIIAANYPLEFSKQNINSVDAADKIVSKIIKQFKFLIETRRISSELYDKEKKPRPESSAQKLFFVAAYSYCDANNLDITPEADTGNGPVDFKFSIGFNCRIIVEIKLSTNPKLVSGFTRQTQKYKEAEEAKKAYYLVINVGKMGKKDEALIREKNSLVKKVKELPEIVFIDGSPTKSASKL